MSKQYDDYLIQHKSNVKKGFDWLRVNLPEVVPEKLQLALEYQIGFAHDASKTLDDEYDAYDQYFYGNNKSYQVVQDFNRAWLAHIHRNPHHWQYWVLICDEGEKIIDMPMNYILEMICDWWSFSWNKDNLYEIFDWYDNHKSHIKLSDKTRKTVEDILDKIHNKLDKGDMLAHHGVEGQRKGVRNGPPYPLHRTKNAAGKEVIIVTKIELTGTPNSVTQYMHKRGGIERNYYDENGRQFKQISNNDHGHPKRHKYGKNGEHAHDYTYDENGHVKRNIREITDEERKENGDIL